MRIPGKHMDMQTGSRADNKRLSSHLRTCTDTWRNVRNARRKDEGQWEYKEVHLLGGEGEEKHGNKTVMSSQEFADGTHTYTQVK